MIAMKTYIILDSDDCVWFSDEDYQVCQYWLDEMTVGEHHWMLDEHCDLMKDEKGDYLTFRIESI